MRTRLAESELFALQQRTQPHFLFNALNAISALVRENRNDQAVQAIARLGALQRTLLEHADDTLVSLAEEIMFIKHYLSLEQLRFGERLHATIEVDADVEGVPLPSLLLQPLVENAVKHGVARRTGISRVIVRVTHEDDCLRVMVRNDPPDLTHAVGIGTGFGLRAVCQRLIGVYGDSASFYFAPDDPQGVTVTLTIPLERSRLSA
ncbi:sensor histidine kinase [Oleiharenicola lentus]|uniref:sensor histidine kinase n=1 Tax=Oleiharenicola lentus TaxID=2508720 RepID=UPI003F674C89